MRLSKLQIAWAGYGFACLLIIVFAFRHWGPIYGAVASFWFLIFVLFIAAIALLLERQQWRFSVRTILIATTLVSVVLGVIAYVLN